jgi:hypothetical protein
VVAVVERWAQSNPASAAAWIGQFAPGTLQNVAGENLVANWFAHDQQGSYDWITSLPPGGLRDAALASYARQRGIR